MNKKFNIAKICEKLSVIESDNDVFHFSKKNEKMPSVQRLNAIVDVLREIIFPGYFADEYLNRYNLSYYMGVNLDKVFHALSEEINRGLCFNCSSENEQCSYCLDDSRDLTIQFLKKLPELREILKTDVQALFEGDPSAKSMGEVIYCFPAIKAVLNYRVAHELWLLKVPIIPRIITEMAHSETGIDIHPGAKIGKYFSIDHGTGVVIGETTIIGNKVKLYQGVTLGAKSFPMDENGKPVKGINRHPIIEDNVIIYSNASILGRIRIGENSVVGENIWVTADLPANSKIIQ